MGLITPDTVSTDAEVKNLLNSFTEDAAGIDCVLADPRLHSQPDQSADEGAMS